MQVLHKNLDLESSTLNLHNKVNCLVLTSVQMFKIKLTKKRSRFHFQSRKSAPAGHGGLWTVFQSLPDSVDGCDWIPPQRGRHIFSFLPIFFPLLWDTPVFWPPPFRRPPPQIFLETSALAVVELHSKPQSPYLAPSFSTAPSLPSSFLDFFFLLEVVRSFRCRQGQMHHLCHVHAVYSFDCATDNNVQEV